MTCKYAQKTRKNTNQLAKWICIRYLHRRRNPDRSEQQSKGVTLQLLIIQTEADELCKQQHWNSEKIQLKASKRSGGRSGAGANRPRGTSSVVWRANFASSHIPSQDNVLNYNSPCPRMRALVLFTSSVAIARNIFAFIINTPGSCVEVVLFRLGPEL